MSAKRKKKTRRARDIEALRRRVSILEADLEIHEHWFDRLDLEVKIMTIVARTIGGQRGSDVHALEWPAVDTAEFASMMVRRPKTEHLSDEPDEDVYEVPPVARPYPKAWWAANGSPQKGPVFPVRHGERAGKAKEKRSHAEALRRDLKRAFGVEACEPVERIRSNGRKNTSYRWKVVRELSAREVELFEGTDRILPVDFHSNRRAFATGLRRAKVDARDAMRLAAHTSFETHQRYVLESGPIAAPPAAALPRLPVDVLPVLRLERAKSDRQRVVSNRGDASFEGPNSLMISSG